MLENNKQLGAKKKKSLAHQSTMKAVAVLFDSNFRRRGIVRFTQRQDSTLITVDAKHVKEGLHGFHVHQSGDLSEGCTSLCSHYNPENVSHGGLHSRIRHRGDLGNVRADAKGEIKQSLKCSRITVQEIIGRSVIIHDQEDDLGRGENAESKKTGNAGKRILCGVIGYASSCT